jgi:hypothetical protein
MLQRIGMTSLGCTFCQANSLKMGFILGMAGLLRAVAPRYRYCSGATYTVAVAVAPLLLVEKNGDGSAATFSPVFWRYALPLLLSTDN